MSDNFIPGGVKGSFPIDISPCRTCTGVDRVGTLPARPVQMQRSGSVSPSEQEIFECVRAIIADTLQLSPEEVGTDSALVEDFDAGSIDFVDILSRIESELHVQFCELRRVRR